MNVDVDYEIPERWRGKSVTLPPYRKDKTHHAEVSNSEVILNIPGNARYLCVHPVTPEEDVSDDSETVCQFITYFNGNKKKTGDEYLDNVINTFSLDKRLERFFKKIY